MFSIHPLSEYHRISKAQRDFYNDTWNAQSHMNPHTIIYGGLNEIALALLSGTTPPAFVDGLHWAVHG